MNKSLLLFFLITVVGCDKAEKKSPNAFFAGEIVNPVDDYVVLYKGDVVIDSAKLDKANRFSIKIDSLAEGLYHFNHSREYQNIYLEQGDSIMIRLNTADGSFDESLVFSGKGEEINNFLLNLFLLNEEEEQMVYSKYYLMEYKDFIKAMDSLKTEKLEDLKSLESDFDLSKNAFEIAKANIDYTYFNYKERYAFEHKKGMRKKEIHKLPDSFYGYRKEVDYGNKNLTYFKPYYDFMRSHIGNLAYMDCNHGCAVKDGVIKNQLHFNSHKLKVIDSIITGKELKDNLFRNVAFDYLLKARDKDENNTLFIEEFHKLSGNNRHLKEIDDLYMGIKNIQPNKEIPNIYVLDFKGDDVSLREIAKNKKAVFYFWSGTDKTHFNSMIKRVQELSTAKPEYSFVGINLMTDEASWKTLLDGKGLDPNSQFRAKDYKELTKTLIIYPLNKCIVTEDTKIVDAFSNMYAASF